KPVWRTTSGLVIPMMRAIWSIHGKIFSAGPVWRPRLGRTTTLLPAQQPRYATRTRERLVPSVIS
ncbi:hypothetical protein BGZ65_000547, partial [Modicella reniformis]